MFKLPELEYAFDALEPYIDAKTMEIHYSKHHQGYVDKLNKALESFPELQEKRIEVLLGEIESVPQDIRQDVINNGGGHANHSFFWQILKKNEEESQGDLELMRKINSTFGSFEDFKLKFSDVATKRFGSGWAWLVKNKNNELELYSTPNQDSPLMKGDTPVIGLDVWEHAYYLKYQNRRPEYIESFFNVVNWEECNELFLS